jgi:DNA primase
VIVAEGYTDVLMLHQAGLRNTVGIMGTAMTPEQVTELARLAPTVLLALDADSAGQEAMLRAERLARARKLAVRVVPLPPGSDPADLVQTQGAAAVASLVGESIPFVQFRVRKTLAGADVSSAEGKDRAIDDLRPAFAPDVLPPSALREELLKTVADRLELPPSQVSSWLAAGAPPRAAAPPAASASAPAPARPVHADAPEREFLADCIALPRVGAELLRAIDPERDLSSSLMRRAHSHLVGHLEAPAEGIAGDDHELRALIAELTLSADPGDVSERDLRALRVQLEFLGVSRQRDHAPPGEKAELSRRRNELQAELARAMQSSLS